MPNQETTPEFVYIYDNQGNVKRVARDYVLRNGLERQILSLSDEERIGYDLGERLEGLEKNKYQGATREYYGACLRLARGETLTDDEAVGFRGAAVVLGHQSPAQIGLDIAEAKRIIQAKKWLQEHAHDAVEAAKAALINKGINLAVSIEAESCSSSRHETYRVPNSLASFLRPSPCGPSDISAGPGDRSLSTPSPWSFAQSVARSSRSRATVRHANSRK